MPMMTDASIVILTYNGEKYLRDLLDVVQCQSVRPLEILAFDSGSEDATLDILETFQIPTRNVKKSEFSHSATRNMAARFCKGRYIIFLTQDAVPANPSWLESLLKPFVTNTNVAGIFSRQICRTGGSLLEANDLIQDFREHSMVKALKPGEVLGDRNIWFLMKFSNSSAAYDRDLLLQNPFLESLEMAEDQEWAKRMIEKGYAIIYEPASIVVHSHEHPLQVKYDRSFRMGKAFSSFTAPILGKRSMVREIAAWFIHICLDAKYILFSQENVSVKLKWMLLSPIHRGVTHYAFRKGWNLKRK